MSTGQGSLTAHPSVSGLTPEQKRDLLLKLLRERGERAGAAPAAPAPAPATSLDWPAVTPDPAHAHDPFPLTDIQHAYWLGRADGLELGGVGSHIYSEFDLPLIDVPRMERAWRAVIERHGMLRTIVEPGGLQRVLASVPPYRIQHTDLHALDAEERAAALSANRTLMQSRRYQPEQWPMFDLRTFTLSAEAERPLTRICLSFDMLILDLRSFQIVLEEWFAYYRDEQAALPALPISFRDYRLAEARIADTAIPQASRAYWAARLPSLPPAPTLPTRRSGEAPAPGSLEARTFKRRATRLSPADWRALKEAASARGLTAASVLLSVFGEVLAAWSGERRFTLTLTVFNRLPLHPSVPRLVGDFTSTSLLEFDLTPGEGFSARAARVQRQLFADLEHRHVSGVQVLRDLAREQGAGWALRPVVFTSHLAGVSGSGDTFTPVLPAEVVDGLSQTPQVSLDYQVFEHSGGLNIQWDAREALFPAGMLDEMFAANERLLRDLTLGGSPWSATQHALAPAHQLAQRGAPTAPSAHDPFSSTQTLPGLFEAQAQRRPHAPALIAGDQTLSYGELERLSAAYAALLQGQGRAGGDQQRPRPIAVVCGRGWEGVVGVLAALRSGGAYLPVDPDQPPERLHALLTRSGTQHVLTQPHLAETLNWPTGLGVSAITRTPPQGHLQAVQIAPTDLAYIIFTSGSTGLPKGVMVDHRGAMNTVLDINARFDVGPADRLLGVSALTFDLSVYDLFGVFAAGAALVLPDHAGRRDPQHWLALIAHHGVTVWNSVPALMEMLLEVAPLASSTLSPSPLALSHLRLILLSGDWIPLSLPTALRRGLPQARLISLGGATEASIWSVLHEIKDVDPQWASVPYGRAMQHQSVQVLDANLNPAPDLAPGELFIGGVGLALGYWQDAERSAERFFYHPRTGERLYRTGDLGRTLPGGSIELLGRVDRQVKLRGHRIELGEIEAAIRAVPGVRETLVTLRRTPGGTPALAAYLIPERPSPKQPAEPDLGASDDEALLSELERELAQAGDALHPYRSGNAELDEQLALLTDLEQRQQFKRTRPAVTHDPAAPRYALNLPSNPLTERLRERRSARRFALAPLPAPDFLSWLAVLLPDEVTGRFLYASAGDLYSGRVYVWVRAGRIQGLPGGAYRLGVQTRHLHALPNAAEVPRRAYHPLINRPMFDEAAFAVFLITDLHDIAPVYGDLSRHFAALEAGLMTGLLELHAAGSPLGVCQVGQIDEDSVRQAFGLGPAHLIVHSLVGGLLEPDRTHSATSAGIADLRPTKRLERLLERVHALSDAEAAAALNELGDLP